MGHTETPGQASAASDTGANAVGWDRLADAYQREVGWPDDDLWWGIRCPPERDLAVVADVVADAAVLVLGCGGGQDLVALARLGAGSLIGVDVSVRQLEHARSRLDHHGIDAQLVRGDAADLREIGDAAVSLVVSVQALDYVADLQRLFGEVRRVLAPGGVLAFSVAHPADLATSDRPPYGWERPYFEQERQWTWDGLGDVAAEFRSWSRSPAAWFTAVHTSGLMVERLLEPPPAPHRRWIEDGWIDDDGYRKLDLVPATIVVRARRR